MVNNPVIYEVLAEQYLRSILDISVLPPQKGLEIPGRRGGGGGGGGGGSQRPKNLKQCMKLNWNFRRGGGVIGQIPSVGGGGMDIFWNHTL